jgi:2-polyprenyl-3-methyl-5-hydroxy-6-metoxy-1,4-benzoquinol methylase
VGTIRSTVVRLSKVLSRQGLYPFLKQHMARLPEGAHVLNVGAGGEVAAVLAADGGKRSLKVISLDIDPKRDPDMVGDVAEFDFGDKRFDAVVMCEVLEHVREPGRAIDNVRRFLRPGGVLILSTPFIFPLHDQPHDYYRFTRHGLEWLLRDFSEVAIAPRNTWAEAINVLWVRLIKENNLVCRLLAPLIVALALAFAPVAMIFGRLIKTDYMTSGYVARAVK